jgi:thioredoxin 1
VSKTVPMLNDQEFELLMVNDPGFIIVAFYAFDSIPCDHFMPEYRKAAETLLEWAKCYSLEVTEHPTIHDAVKVIYVPTVLIFKEGKEIKRLEGPYSKEALQSRICGVIRKNA